MVALHETPAESVLAIEKHTHGKLVELISIFEVTIQFDIRSVCFDSNVIKHIDDCDTQISH